MRLQVFVLHEYILILEFPTTLPIKQKKLCAIFCTKMQNEHEVPLAAIPNIVTNVNQQSEHKT
jgi:hypothetical protein